MTVRRLLIGSAAAALAPLAWLACNAIAGIGEPVEVEPSPQCVPALPPAAPKGSDTGDAGVVFALRNLQFGKEQNATMIPAAPGYDLDGVCTCPGESSCKPISSTSPVCDFDAGSDNGFIGLYAKYEAMISMGTVNTTLNQGEFGFLFIIDDYNGTDNDPVVKARFYSASRLAAYSDGGKPAWNGGDVWNIDEGSQTDAGEPKHADPSAYVSGGVLVSRLPTAALYFPMFNAPLRFEIFDAVVTGRISREGGVFVLKEGQFAGRMPVDKLLRSVGQLPYLAEPVLCQSETGFPVVRSEVCRRADIHFKSGGSPSAPCDALSFTLAFDAVQAVTGVVETVTKPVEGACPPDASFNCEGVF